MIEFRFSKSIVKNTIRLLLLVVVIAIPCAFAFLLFLSNFDVSASLISTGYTFAFIGLLLTVETFLIFRQQWKTKVVIEDDKIVRQWCRRERDVLWHNIAKIKIVETVKGGIHAIILYETNNRALRLYGFSGMENMANLIKEKIPDNVSISVKRDKLDWGNFLVLATVLICSMAITGLFVLILFRNILHLF